MFVTKKALPRRTVLRGLGATVALPFLDAMVPALTATAQTAAAPVPRMAFFSVPNGMFLPNFHPKGGGGTDFELTPILQPLAGLRDQIADLKAMPDFGSPDRMPAGRPQPGEAGSKAGITGPRRHRATR